MPSTSGKTKVLYLPIQIPEGASRQELDALFVTAVLDAARARGMQVEMTVGAPGPSAPAPRRPLPAMRDQERARPRGRAPDPAGFPAGAAFRDGLRRLRAWAGDPSLRELAQRATDLGSPLTKSTLQRILAPDATRLPTEEQLIGLVLACGASEHECRAWLDVLSRAQASDTVASGAADEQIARGNPGAELALDVTRPRRSRVLIDDTLSCGSALNADDSEIVDAEIVEDGPSKPSGAWNIESLAAALRELIALLEQPGGGVSLGALPGLAAEFSVVIIAGESRAVLHGAAAFLASLLLLAAAVPEPDRAGLAAGLEVVSARLTITPKPDRAGLAAALEVVSTRLTVFG